MQDSPRAVTRTGWRPRFSVGALLTVTLVVALTLGFFYQRSRVKEAEAILIANGLKWELAPLAKGKFRVTIRE